MKRILDLISGEKELINIAGAAWFYARHAATVSRYLLSPRKLSDTNFVIFGRGRSGTTALVSLLNNVPSFVCDDEILNRQLRSPLLQVLSRSYCSGADTYGFKLLSYQLRNLGDSSAQLGFMDKLNNHNFKVIYLRRENLLMHAVSNMRARTVGFHRRIGSEVGVQRVTLDINDLETWLLRSEDLFSYEKKVLENTDSLNLVYENDLESESMHSATLAKICAFLGVSDPIYKAKSQYEKISPRTLEQSIENYDEVVRALSNTRFEKYL